MKKFAILLILFFAFSLSLNAQEINRGMLNLAGPVKSMETISSMGTKLVFTFDEEGRVVSKTMNDQVVLNIDWSNLEDGEMMYTFSNVATGEALQKGYVYYNIYTPEKIEAEENNITYTYTFHKNGMIDTFVADNGTNKAKMVSRYKEEGDIVPTSVDAYQDDNLMTTINIEVEATDSHGNATSYNREMNGQTEHIDAVFTYYE